MEALWVLVLAAAVVLLCLGLVVLLGNPEQLDPPDPRDRKGHPVYPDRQVSPELRERLEEKEEAPKIMTADMETNREEDEIPTIPEKDTGKPARKERKNK